jgi:hypothetical protein
VSGPACGLDLRHWGRFGVGFRVLLILAALVWHGAAAADTLRIGFWNADLSRKGPGLLLRDALRGTDPQITAALAAITGLDADVLVLGDIDYDAGAAALAALNDRLPRPYPHILALRPNTGIPSGHDLDGNGRRDEARDAIGYGTFPGQGGMAILSRLPFGGTRDFNAYLWRDLPGTLRPADQPEDLPLSTSGHHDTAVLLPDGRALHLMSWHATTPAFDGPEDRNGRRNHDETAFWTQLLGGALPFAPPLAPFVIIGQANADPTKGDGRPDAIRALLISALLQDTGGGATVDYGGSIGALRVTYILPSADISVTDSGQVPATAASRHLPIWVEADF